MAAAATSGDARFFLGTDSAPHARGTKECGCGCAGVFSAHAALPLYAMAFERAGALDKLEARRSPPPAACVFWAWGAADRPLPAGFGRVGGH